MAQEHGWEKHDECEKNREQAFRGDPRGTKGQQQDKGQSRRKQQPTADVGRLAGTASRANQVGT